MIFQNKLLYFDNKSAIHKAIMLLTILLFYLLNLSAQENSNLKLKIETGILMASDESDFGLFLSAEPKLKISKNTAIGLKFGAAVNTQKIKTIGSRYWVYQYNNGLIRTLINNNRILSIVPTYNFYFMKNRFRPYLGLGIGYYFLTTHRDFFGDGPEPLQVSVNNQVGFLLRSGLELGKFIIGLEFNFIPKADIKRPNGERIATLANSNIGLSIGYEIRSRKISE